MVVTARAAEVSDGAVELSQGDLLALNRASGEDHAALLDANAVVQPIGHVRVGRQNRLVVAQDGVQPVSRVRLCQPALSSVK